MNDYPENNSNTDFEPKVKVSGENPAALRSDISEARREAFSSVNNANTDEDGDEYAPAVKIVNAPQGIDNENKPKNSGLKWIILFLFLLLLIFGGALVWSIMRGQKQDEIDVGAESNSNRRKQYDQVDETLKNQFANASPSPDQAQPTPPPANANSNTYIDQNLPPADWDKVPNPNAAPKGSVGESLDNNSNSQSSNSNTSSPSIGGGRGNQISLPSGPARIGANPVGTPQLLEISRTGANQPGSSSRNDQTSIYYYGRTNQGEPILNKIAASPVLRFSQKPRFNDVLPVRILGAIHTLGSGGLARMVTTRAVEGNGYYLPKGTFFIGRISGGEADRLFVALIGYIDPQTQGLVTLGGDVSGVDGALGLKGERKRLDSRFKKFFGEAWRASRELGIAYLLGRRGGGSNWNSNIDSRIQSLSQNLDQNQAKEYILVQSGQEGYIVVNDLPPATEKPALPPATVLPETTQTARLPVETTGVTQTDFDALAAIGEPQIRELMAMPAQDRERALAKYSPQVREILREVLK